MTVTKADLGNTLFDEVGLNKREAKDFVELFFEKIRQSLEKGSLVRCSAPGRKDCGTGPPIGRGDVRGMILMPSL